MGTALSTYWPTLVDVARRMDPDGKIANVAEVLNQYNEILDDIPWKEGNLPTGEKLTLRGSLPTPTWRLFNQGVQPTKSTTKQITETCGMAEARSEVDKDEAMLNGNTAEWRFSEAKAFIEGMNQEVSRVLIYGDTSLHPEQFVGLAPRLWTKTAASSSNASFVIDAGGSTNLTSIYLVGWSPETVYGIFPKGSVAGLLRQDLGEQTVITESTNLSRMQALVERFQWKCGLAIKDYRYVVRIANIDTVALATAGDTSDTSANLFKFMSIALDKLFNISMVRPVFYMNNLVRSYLRVKLISKSNLWLHQEDLQGPTGIPRPTLSFQGYPCRRIDQITNAETQVS